MTLWMVWRSGRFAGCWECNGGGDSDLWQVYAESPVDALRLVRDGLTVESWEEPFDLHCLAVAPSRARKARILSRREWLADLSMVVEPPAPNF